MCCGYQEPFGAYFHISAKTELPKTLHMFDLAYGRFGDALASTIESPPRLGQELAHHPFLDRETAGDTSPRKGAV